MSFLPSLVTKTLLDITWLVNICDCFVMAFFCCLGHFHSSCQFLRPMHDRNHDPAVDLVVNSVFIVQFGVCSVTSLGSDPNIDSANIATQNCASVCSHRECREWCFTASDAEHGSMLAIVSMQLFGTFRVRRSLKIPTTFPVLSSQQPDGFCLVAERKTRMLFACREATQILTVGHRHGSAKHRRSVANN